MTNFQRFIIQYKKNSDMNDLKVLVCDKRHN